MEEQPDVEILIHIGAPSRAVDDARYRSLAAAYLACQSTKAVHIHSQSEHDGNNQVGSQSQEWMGDNFEVSSLPSDNITGSFQSQQLSFRSVVDNVGSPRMPMRGMSAPAPVQETPVSRAQGSWQTPPSIVQDSHPMDHIEFASLTSPTRVLENHLQNFESQLGSSKQQHPQSSGTVASAGPISRSEYHEGRTSRNMVPCTPQMIPCTPRGNNIAEPSPVGGEGSEYHDSDDTQDRLQALVSHDSPNDTVENTVFLSSSQLSPLVRADSEPPSKSRHLKLAADPHALTRASSDIGPRALPRGKAPVEVEFVGSHGFTYESLEIHPPDPPASEPHIEPQDLITEFMRTLRRDGDLPSGYRRKRQTRALRPYERGHWLLDCSSWEPGRKRSTWALLANHIGTGTVGWGVWCKRDPEFNELRTYCWGAVVAHIYCLLWLASQRTIDFTGSAWVDAEGTSIIIIGPKDHP